MRANHIWQVSFVDCFNDSWTLAPQFQHFQVKPGQIYEGNKGEMYGTWKLGHYQQAQQIQMNDFQRRFKNYDNQQLLKIIEDVENYEPAAVEAAKLELSKRDVSQEEIQAASKALQEKRGRYPGMWWANQANGGSIIGLQVHHIAQ